MTEINFVAVSGGRADANVNGIILFVEASLKDLIQKAEAAQQAAQQAAPPPASGATKKMLRDMFAAGAAAKKP